MNIYGHSWPYVYHIWPHIAIYGPCLIHIWPICGPYINIHGCMHMDHTGLRTLAFWPHISSILLPYLRASINLQTLDCLSSTHSQYTEMSGWHLGQVGFSGDSIVPFLQAFSDRTMTWAIQKFTQAVSAKAWLVSSNMMDNTLTRVLQKLTQHILVQPSWNYSKLDFDDSNQVRGGAGRVTGR